MAFFSETAGRIRSIAQSTRIQRRVLSLCAWYVYSALSYVKPYQFPRLVTVVPLLGIQH